MKIKSIYIDGLHNAVDKTYNFGDINYIFGNNGIGKSTILQAIQLALLGYIPGTAKNTREALLRHSPRNSIDVRLTVEDSGHDIIIERKIEEKATKVITMPDGYDISSVISAIELPIFNFNEFVGQTANKLKEYFIKNILPTSGGDLDWEQILTESIKDANFPDRQAIIDYGLSVVSNLESVEILDLVIEANTKFKAEQSFNKTEQQKLQNTVDSLIYYDDYTGPTDEAELNVKILTVGALRDQAIKYKSAYSAVGSAKDELEAINAKMQAYGGDEAYVRMNAECEKARAIVADLQKTAEGYTTAIAQLQAEESATRSILNGQGVCPYTKESCPSIMQKLESIQIESETRQAKIANNTKALEDVRTKLATYDKAIKQREAAMEQYKNFKSRYASLSNSIGKLPEKPNTDKTVEELTAELEQLNQNKTKLQANLKYNETIENITKLKYEAELQGTALAAWVKKTDTNGLQTTLMEAPFQTLANTMTGYIQQMYGRSDIRAHFNVTTKANSFSFGLIRNGVYIPYDLLSSGEKCLYTLALMICITDNSESPLKLMLCDDMFDHLDAVAIESTFDALKKVRGIQFIFAGVKDCKNAEDILITV